MAVRNDLSFRGSLAIAVLLLLGAFFVRASDLAHTPPGIGSDITWKFADAVRISRGIPYPAVFGDRPEPLHRFLLGAWAAVTGLKTFSLLFFSVLVGTFTLALTYRTAWLLLANRLWRRFGALCAMGALAAMMPNLFLDRAAYRAVLTPVVLLAAMNLFLRASRSKRGRDWMLGGLLAASGVHTYLAGIITPLWAAAFVGHQAVIARRELRIGLRSILLTGFGMIPPLLVWLGLILAIPNLFSRVQSVSSSTPFVESLAGRIGGVIQAFFFTGFPHPLYNTPDTPFLNPALAILALIGIGTALWGWRTAESALLLGGLLLFSLPGAFSREPGHPLRLVGTMPILALLSGWGGMWIMQRAAFLVSTARLPTVKSAGTVVFTTLVVLSLAGTHLAYHAMFHDPVRYKDPAFWLDIPHNYTIAYVDALEALAKVDKPTYVPLSVLNTPAAMFVLQSEAFPNVTTWARYGLTELPEGQIFYPTHVYYHDPAPEQDALQGLLLPDEKTIVILPGDSGRVVISMPAPGAGQDIVNERGWVVARIAPRDAEPLKLPVLHEDNAPLVVSGLKLLGTESAASIQPGANATALLYWGVIERQPADIFTITQSVNLDWNAVASSDHHVLPYLYPSAMWQPGDVIPDLHSIQFPLDLPDGVYRWISGAYVPPGQARLPLVTPRGESYPLPDVWAWGVLRLPLPPVGEPLPAASIPVDIQFSDGIGLEGYSLAQSELEWTLTLYWRASTNPSGDYTVFVHAMNDVDMVTQQDVKPYGGRLPTWAWQPGELVTTTHTLTLPAGSLKPDALYVGLYEYPSLERLSVAVNQQEIPDKRALLWSGD